MTITIYHNSRCSKSRQALKLLEESGVAFEVIEYLKTPVSESTIRALHQKIGGDVRAMIRTKEAIYKELGLKTADDDTLFAAMAKHPILIERAIIEKGDDAIIARPPELALAFIQ